MAGIAVYRRSSPKVTSHSGAPLPKPRRSAPATIRRRRAAQRPAKCRDGGCNFGYRRRAGRTCFAETVRGNSGLVRSTLRRVRGESAVQG